MFSNETVPADNPNQSSQDALRLTQAVDRLRLSDPKTIAADLCDIRDILDDLALQLRLVHFRPSLGAGEIPCSLAALLEYSSIHLSTPSVYELPHLWEEVRIQTGRVAANLVADCDVNRDRLVKASYLFRVLQILGEIDISRSTALRPLTASLFNLTTDHHAPSLKEVATEAGFGTLLKLANELHHQPGRDLGPVTGSLPADERHQIIRWLWAIIMLVVEEETESISALISKNHVRLLIQPLSPFLPSSGHDINDDTTRRDDLISLTAACTVLERLASSDRWTLANHPSPLSAVLLDTNSASLLESLVDFADYAKAPDVWGLSRPSPLPSEADVDSDEDGSTLEDCAKVIVAGKTAVLRGLLDISSSMQTHEEKYAWFWIRMREWSTKNKREDLVSFSLLAFGNSAREDVGATALLAEDKTLLPTICSLLRGETPLTVQHALVGLLKNLSIPPENKDRLGEAAVLQHLSEMGAWRQERDVVGSVQGGATSVAKNLCKNHAINSTFLIMNPTIADQLLSLVSRSEDPAIRFEATRVFVNIARSLYAGSNEMRRVACDRLCSPSIIHAFCIMLQTGRQYPVLVNEAIIALTLMATFGKPDTSDAIIQSLRRSLDGSVTEPLESGACGLKALCKLLAPDPEAEQVTPEIQSNAITLLNQLIKGEVESQDGIREVITKSMGDARMEGRQVAFGALALIQ